MKCDELKQYEVFVSNPYNTGGSFREIAVLPADKVYEAIAELKAENKLPKEHIANGDVSRITWIDEVIELKQKLEDVQASAYAESVDAGMRERRLRRALWLARAEWARSSALSYHLIESHPDKDVSATYKRKANKWEKAKDKCLKKAEEYK